MVDELMRLVSAYAYELILKGPAGSRSSGLAEQIDRKANELRQHVKALEYAAAKANLERAQAELAEMETRLKALRGQL